MDKNRAAAFTGDTVTNVLPHPGGRPASVSSVRPHGVANRDAESDVPTRIGPPPVLPQEAWGEATVIHPVRHPEPRTWRDDDATVVDRTLGDVERALHRESSNRMHRVAPAAGVGPFEAATIIDKSLLSSRSFPVAASQPQPATKVAPLTARPGMRAQEKTVIVVPPPGTKRGKFSRGPGRRNVISLAIIVGALAFAAVASLLVVFESPARSGLRPPRTQATPQAQTQAAGTAKVDPRPTSSAAPALAPAPVVPALKLPAAPAVISASSAAPLAQPSKATGSKASPVTAPEKDESGNVKRSLERRAADLVARGERPAAADLYAQLAAKNPDSKAYREALRILRASADGSNGQ